MHLSNPIIAFSSAMTAVITSISSQATLAIIGSLLACIASALFSWKTWLSIKEQKDRMRSMDRKIDLCRDSCRHKCPDGVCINHINPPTSKIQ